MRKPTTLSPYTTSRWFTFPEMDRLWHQLTGFPYHAAGNGTDHDDEANWSPAIDIVESPTGYEVRADLAGVDAKDVDVSLNGDVLTIRGEKQVEQKQENDNWTRRERVFGSFQRSFTLPAPVDAEKIVAEAKNGVLTVRIPKAKEAKPHKIQVQSN
ncbi:MAG: Hsp20/alpha crystallin family protein [Planctomycetota bacterium]|jgi:HSP20 family protein